MKSSIIKMAGFAALAVVLLASCSPKVYTQKADAADLNNYKSFAWVETQETHEQKGHNDIQEEKIRKAVNAELQKMGWREDNTKPEALLAYDVLIERATKQNSNPVYSQPFSRSYYNPYLRRWGTLYYPSQFVGYRNQQYQTNEGTLTVSVLDAKTEKTVWQGWTTDEVRSNKVLSDKDIQASVRNIFRKFDVAKN